MSRKMKFGEKNNKQQINKKSPNEQNYKPNLQQNSPLISEGILIKNETNYKTYAA